ncbi:MAG: hypothetical protein F6K10_32360 [Moorea sp. SIO2B7]|nr:hypothetical protein [Moorena sp. SIO2B7]
MDIEKALEFADTLVFAKKAKHLSDLQTLLLRASWSEPRQRYEEIAHTYGYSVNYLKQDAGPKLWQLLSEVCGEKVKKTNFRAALERQFVERAAELRSQTEDTSTSKCSIIALPSEFDVFESITQTETGKDTNALHRVSSDDFHHHISRNKHYQDWGEAPDVSVFYDRFDEVAKLGRWIVSDRCRLVALLGMGGIGKTHLCVKLAEHVQHDFEYLIWRSLSNAPPLQKILTSLLQSLTKGQEIDLPASLEEKISQLIDYFRQHRCLVILDNAETILCSGGYAGYCQDDYEDYGKLFKRIGECRHDSCLILTSREKPKEIALMQGETLPVRCLNLQGLDVEGGLQLLQLKGCSWQSETESSLLVERYSGNPLALKIVAATIQELFEGNLSEFIQHNTLVFDEIRTILTQQFNRLSDLGKILLYWLAINIEPVSADQLHSDIFPKVPKSELIETIKSLVWRSLIEKTDNHFSLQPVVREYLLSKLIKQLVGEIKTGNLVLLNSLSLLKGQTKEYIRKTQVDFIVNPLIEGLIAIFKTQSNLENRLKEIIAKLQIQSPLEPGYTAGNILNILGQLQTDLSGFDFSNLTIWQAYLQYLKLQNANFAHADLSKSVFAQHLTNILSVAFSPEGQILATGDANGEIRLWRIVDSKLLLIFKGHSGWVHSVSFSPDGRILSSGSSDQTIKLWNISDGKCLKTLSGHNQRVRSVAFSPDGNTLACRSTG